MECAATIVIDFDSIFCRLEDGHDGMHLDHAEGGSFNWTDKP